MMKQFVGKDFLLTNKTGMELYGLYAKSQPIYDFHCHLSPQDIAEDKRYSDISELWLADDHYKWRIMRAYGIPEELITGKATSPQEKFKAFAEALPAAVGNPIYHWSHMELNNYFGIHEPLSGKSSDRIWRETTEKIQSEGFSAQALIARSNVELIATTDDPTDDLKWHLMIANIKDFATRVVPTWRPDKAVAIASPGFMDYLEKLASSANATIGSFDEYLDVLRKRMDFFETVGCRSADHGIVALPSVQGNYNDAKATFNKVLAKVRLQEEEVEKFTFHMLSFFGCEYSRRGWVMQLHLSAVRNQNTKLFDKLGPDCGVDSSGDPVTALALGRLFDEIEKAEGMPKTVLYTLNPTAYYVLATMAGNFSGGIRGKMQLGAAWWMLDHRDGMREQLRILANTGVLGLFIGMLTDSRSFLSYVRHDYFRRVL
ncbi:MAG: uronate isomerase, partial [Firmicutes bacterium]|nr:uronate isomerase [Bacillota bacterium]